MIDLEKLETNVFEIINILSDNELLKQEKFKNIYQINEKISSNFNYFLDSLKFRKIKNLDEVKIKFNENLKYFKNFSFIQKKINLIVLNNLSIEKKKKLNNQFLDEIILYFNQKKYEINAIIYLGYQKIEKVDKLVDEIDFLNKNIESNFEIFNKNIQNFNNLEKNNSINFYTEISKNSSKNNFVQEKLKKINKKFFFHDEYLSLKKEIDFRLDENIQSDANSADSAVNTKEVELFNNFPKIKLEMENLKNELNQLAEASEIYDDKNLVNFSDLLDALKNINIREILKSNETFEIIFFKNSESDEHEKIIFNFSDNWQSIEDKFHLYFNKMTNYVRRYALKNLRDVYIFTTKFIEVNNKFSNLAKSNLINFKKTSDKDFLKLEYLKNLQGVKLYDNVWFDSGIETFLVQNGLDNNTFFDSEEFRKNFNLLRARLFEKTEIKSLPSDSFKKLEIINSSLKKTYSEGSKNNFNKVEPGKHFLDIIKKSVQESKNSFFEWDGKSFINFFSLIFNNNKFDKEIAKEFLEKKSFQEIKDLIINLNNQKIVKIFNWFKDYYANLTENKYKYFNKIKNFFADSEIEEEIRTNKNLSKIMKDYNSLPYGAVNIFGLLKLTFVTKEKLDHILNNFTALSLKTFSSEFHPVHNNFFRRATTNPDSTTSVFSYPHVAKLFLSIFIENFEKKITLTVDVTTKNNQIQMVDEIKNVLLSTNNLSSYDYDDKEIDKINILLSKYEDKFFDISDFLSKTISISQKETIDKEIDNLKESYDLVKNIINDLKQNSFAMSLFTDKIKDDVFQKINEIDLLLSEFPNDDLKTYSKKLESDNNFLIFLENTSSNIEEIVTETKNNFKKIFFEKLLEKIQKENFTNYFNENNINKFSAIEDLYEVFSEIYNLDILEDLVASNVFENNDLKKLNLANKIFDLLKTKNIKDYSDYKKNYINVNEFVNKITKIKENIDTNVYNEDLINFNLDKNDDFFHQKEKIILSLKKYQLNLIYEKNGISKKIFQDRFNYTNDEVDSLDFLLSKKSDLENIIKNLAGNKKNILQFKNLFLEKYEFFNNMFSSSFFVSNELNLDDPEFNNLSDLFNEIINIQENEYDLNFVTKYTNTSQKINFNKSEIDFENNDLKVLKKIVKNYFDYLFAEKIVEFTKVNINSFDAIIWDKVIQENNYLKQFYATWKSDNFTKDFLQKNNFDDFNTQNFVNFSSILRTLEAEYKKNTNFNILFEELIKDKKNLFFYLSKNEIKVNSKLLDNIKLNDYFFFENFQKDFQNSFNLKNFDSLKKYNNFSIENTNNFETLKDKIKEVFSWLLEKNILLAKNIFNNAIKDYEKFLSISKNFNFVNYFLTSHEKNRLEQIFNYFKKNSNLEYKNLEIINNISLYKSYFDNFNEDEIFNNKNNILALFDNSLDLEKYFLICAKGYLFFNSELIDQNKFNNFLQSNKNNYEIKDEYKNNYFDFDDPLYKNHLDNVDTKWNLKSIINIHDELFLQTDNFQKFYNNLKIITKLSNDDTSLNFSEKLEENNLIFKINFLKNKVDELNKTWNDFFDKFFNEYPVFNYNNVLNSLKDEKFNKIKNELKIENFSNLNRQEFIDKISIKIGELSLSEDKEKNELLNKSVINLKQKLFLDKEIKNLYSEKSNENYLNFYHLRNRLPSDFELELNICTLDINDLYLTEEELKQKYSTSLSKFIFNDFSKKQKFFENFKKYLSFSEFRNIIFHRSKIYIDYYIGWSKIENDNFSDFDFVLDYEAKLLEKYTNDQTIGANEKKVLIEYINEKVDQKLFLKLFSELIKNKLQPIKFFKNDLNFLKKIDQNFSATEDDKSIKIIFFDENIDLLITKYQENKNLASSNPFSKTNIYKKISDYINFGTKNNILTSLEYLDTEVQKITKQSYYTDLYTNFLKQPNIFKSLSDDINNLYQKIAIDPNLKQTYKIVLDGTEHLLSSVNPRDFQNIAAIFFNKQKSLIFKEIILNYFNKYQNFFQYYEEFADFNENDDDEKTIKLFFDYFSANFSELSEDDKLNWILTNVENRNIENKFNIFDNYLTKIEKKSRFSFKEYIVNFLENIKKNSIVFDDAITANTNNFFDLENINIKSLKNINLDELNFDIGDFDSYINLKNIYNLLLKNHTEVDNINYNFSTLKATLKNLENLYLSSENKIIQKKILNIVSLYDKLNQNYKGFHYLSSDKFNLNEQKILDIFKNFKKEEKIYYLFNFSENGTEYQNFLKEQSDKLLSEKLSIIKEVKEQNFYGYNFDLDQANEWWYSKKPAYIDEVLKEKIKLGHNASQILKDKFLNQSIISDLKQLIKNNIVLKDLKNLFKEQEKIFLNFWYQDQNKVIENFSINLEKTEYLLENYSFNFYKIAKQFFNQIKEMQKEQVTIFNKYQELEKKSLVFKHSNQIIKVQNVEKTASGALLKKEQENVYSIENKKEKYFIIGINYGFLIVLKTTDFQNKLKDCIFTEKTVFDLHRLKKTSLNDANIFISDKKIVLEDKKNQKVLVSIEYEDLIENIKEDLLNFEANDFENIQNFYKTLKNQKIIIENNLYSKEIKETFYSTLDFDSDSKNLLWKIQNFYYREDNIWPVKNFVLYDVYNKNNVLVILFNNFDANSSKKEKEFIYKIELDKSIWYPEKAIEFFNNHNIEYLEKELSENLKKTAKITPYIVISVATLGIFSAFVILIKKFIKNQKIKKKFKNSKKN